MNSERSVYQVVGPGRHHNSQNNNHLKIYQFLPIVVIDILFVII